MKLPITTLTLAGQTYRCRVARTWASRRRGMAQTERAEWTGIDGLLICFPFRWWWGIWMRGMRFDIDLIWLQDDRILQIESAVSPHPWRSYWPRQPCSAVFEQITGDHLSQSPAPPATQGKGR